MAITKVMGIETEYGITVPGAPDSNPVLASSLLVNAFSPALFALIVDQIGWHNGLYVLLASSILTWIAIELMSRWYEGARAGKG